MAKLLQWNVCGLQVNREDLTLQYYTNHITTTAIHVNVITNHSGVPRRQPHRRSGLATLPSVGAVP